LPAAGVDAGAGRCGAVGHSARWTGRAAEGGCGCRRHSPGLDLPFRELRLKYLAGGQDRRANNPPRVIRSAGPADLPALNRDLLELHIVALSVRCVTDARDREALRTAPPADVEAAVLRVLGDPVEDLVGWNGEDAGPDLFKGQLDDVSLGNVGASDHPDH